MSSLISASKRAGGKENFKKFEHTNDDDPELTGMGLVYVYCLCPILGCHILIIVLLGVSTK
jgi:hypothetical protein